jgi:DNA-binding IclR family transcriptional regulator
MTGTGSAERILAILDVFSEARPEWTPEDLMAELGYSRPTMYRYLKSLREAGFLSPISGGGFTLGPRFVEMDFLMRRSDPLIRLGRGYLEQLVARYPCSALLVRWYGGKLLCVDSECSVENPVSSYPRGRPMPLARGAISRAIMAYLPRRRLEALMDGQDTDTLTDTLKQVRRDGVAEAHGEVTPGVIGVASPVFDAGTLPVASLSVTIAADVCDAARLEKIRADVRDAAERLSGELGQARQDDGGAEAPRLARNG